VLVLDWVESVLVVSEYTRLTRKTYITFTLVSVL
jgi:hypothetical protein